MANIEKKEAGRETGKQSGELMRREPSQSVTREGYSHPFQMLREMLIDPFRLFSQSPWGAFGRGQALTPSFEVRETDDAFVFKADLPGIRADDLDVSLAGRQLQISGKREHEKEEGEGQYHTYERSYGSFTRSFTLPDSADLEHIRSDLKDGVLTLLVPKREGGEKRRKIAIGSGEKS
jgi:HSP20 family protein